MVPSSGQQFMVVWAPHGRRGARKAKPKRNKPKRNKPNRKRCNMTMHQFIGIAVGLLVVGFIVFAFRQGEKVRPSGRDPAIGIEDIPPSNHNP